MNGNIDIANLNGEINNNEVSAEITSTEYSAYTTVVNVNGTISKKTYQGKLGNLPPEKDHSKLNNLDFENSGHTGFASEADLKNKVDKEEGKGLSSNDFTTADKEKLEGIEDNANYYTLPDDVVQDENYVHTDLNFTQEYATKIDSIIPFIPQTRISQVVENGQKYLKIEWDYNESFSNFQETGKVKLYLYKYTKTGRKTWVDKQTGLETYKKSIKKWVHPANEYRSNDPANQCWGIRSFQSQPDLETDIDDVIDNSEYPIANNGLVQTEYNTTKGQNVLKIPLNDIISPILKVAKTGNAKVQLPTEGDGQLVMLMGVKQKIRSGRCNLPIKFCLAIEDEKNKYIGSCLNVATIQLFQYRTDRNNHGGHGYSEFSQYSILPDIGYSVYIK